ncbi:phage tail assembly protein [Methylobacterium gregans]|uniref:phage tail assembly protein n=1 Tax=Methylobacterium gregans TaxID=374424 RepID=UPI003605FA47
MDTPAPAPAADTPPVEAALLPAAPRFAGTRVRDRVVLLDWPIAYDGQVYDQITVHRPTTQDVADFVARVNAAPENASVHFPMYDVPFAVLDALDPDDADAVNAAVADFCPAAGAGRARQPRPLAALPSPDRPPRRRPPRRADADAVGRVLRRVRDRARLRAR